VKALDPLLWFSRSPCRRSPFRQRQPLSKNVDLAALLKARNSNASYSTIRKTIRSEVDLFPAFSGKTVSGGRVNTNKALLKIGS
jgi:hypothetical protein